MQLVIEFALIAVVLPALIGALLAAIRFRRRR